MPLLKMIKYSQADKLPICQRSLLICDGILQNRDFRTQFEGQPLNLPKGGRACIHANRNQISIFLRAQKCDKNITSLADRGRNSLSTFFKFYDPLPHP